MGYRSLAEYEKMAADLSFSTKPIIDGKSIESESGRLFETVNPANGRVITEIVECGTREVDLAVSAARRAFESGIWSKDAQLRREVLLKLADLVDQNAEMLAVMETLDSGKPISDNLEGDLPSVSECLRFSAEAIDKLNGSITPTEDGELCLVKGDPLGVCAIVMPWNFPIGTAGMKIAPVLAAGNTAVIKPAQATSLTAIRLAELALEAGMPEGVLNVVTGPGNICGKALAEHMDVDMITFTGSTEVGKSLLIKSGQTNGKRVLLEMGGKSPAIIMPDIEDIDTAAEEVAAAAMWNMGENCTQNSRIIVHKDIKPVFLPKFIEAVKTFNVGNPLDPNTAHGAIITREHMEKILHYVEIGKEEGADLLFGARQILAESGGNYIEPGIFDNCNQSMTIMRDEIFGPVVGIETFDTIDEAVAMANDTQYGLHASVFTDNINNAFKLSNGIRAGVVSVNLFSEGNIATPFGGAKQSGFFGRDNSLEGIRQYMETKAVYIKTR